MAMSLAIAGWFPDIPFEKLRPVQAPPPPRDGARRPDRLRDKTGDRIGHIIVLKAYTYWRMRCDCGSGIGHAGCTLRVRP
jgi:hypothetical protein